MNGEKEMWGYFLSSNCKRGEYNAPKGIEEGKKYEILGEEQTFLGPQLIIKVGNREVMVPKECMLIKSGNVYMGSLEGKPLVNRENTVQRFRISKDDVDVRKKTIIPKMLNKHTDKLRSVLCDNGDIYFLFDKNVHKPPYGYVGRAFNGPPELEKAFQFKTILPFPYGKNKTRWFPTWVTIYSVKMCELIGKDFYRVKGLTKNKAGKLYPITAYVSL